MNAAQPLLIVFAGPNGAGKSTLRRITLSSEPLPFVNADEIAAFLFGPDAPARAYEAAAIAESIRSILLERRRSFSFETVLSDPAGAKIQFIAEARAAGYHVAVHFVGLDSPDTSRLRVIQRVNEGGHDVPDDKIAARYSRVMANLRRLLDIPDDLVIYDNSSAAAPYQVIARLSRGLLTEIASSIPAWAHFLDLTSRVIPQTRLLS